jgi:hypothetical protein
MAVLESAPTGHYVAFVIAIDQRWDAIDFANEISALHNIYVAESILHLWSMPNPPYSGRPGFQRATPACSMNHVTCSGSAL